MAMFWNRLHAYIMRLGETLKLSYNKKGDWDKDSLDYLNNNNLPYR